MAELKMVRVNELIEDHGDKWRIERRTDPERAGHTVTDPLTGREVNPVQVDNDGNPLFHFVVYEKVETGVEKDDDGKVTKLGLHPVIKDKGGDPIETHYEYVWVPRFAGIEDEARAKLKELARG